MPKVKSTASRLQKEQIEMQKIMDRVEEIKRQRSNHVMTIAEKSGFFDVDVSDESIEKGFLEMVKSASSPKVISSTPPTLVRKVATGS